MSTDEKDQTDILRFVCGDVKKSLSFRFCVIFPT